KNIEKTNLGRIQRTPLRKVMSGIASSEFLADCQIDSLASKPTSNTSLLPVDRRPTYALTKTTMNQTYKGRLPSKNNIKVKPNKPFRFPNGQAQVHEKINSLVNEPIEFVKDRKYHRLS
ncbi:TPA: hypothetical protein U1383_002400, partial [Streptococcus suis]|nr:hypothetical protein [Streptococcus suis]